MIRLSKVHLTHRRLPLSIEASVFQLIPLLFNFAAQIAGQGFDGDAVLGAEGTPEYETRVVLSGLVRNCVVQFWFLFTHFVLPRWLSLSLVLYGTCGKQFSKFFRQGLIQHAPWAMNCPAAETAASHFCGRALRVYPHMTSTMLALHEAELERYFSPVGALALGCGSSVMENALALRPA